MSGIASVCSCRPSPAFLEKAALSRTKQNIPGWTESQAETYRTSRRKPEAPVAESCSLKSPNLRGPAFRVGRFFGRRVPVAAEQHHQARRRGGMVETHPAGQRVLGRLIARHRGSRKCIFGETGGGGVPPAEQAGRGFYQIDGIGRKPR